ncbi:MAG TPA: SGNH/GDSL hydrolase family protein [Herpetosiphonaceae bacterium]
MPSDKLHANVEQPAAQDELRVLFIGNSQTYSNDLPAIVEALAQANGKRFSYHMIAQGGVSLIEHWNGGEARPTIARGGWDVVVLQQGPSSTPENRALLIDYTRRFAKEIRAAGAEPALYMVWPETRRFGDFDRMSDSYRLAAEAVDGILLPAGEAWRAAWRHDPKAGFYSRDGLHPSTLGSYLTALVIYGRLYGELPPSLPKTLQIRSRRVSRIELRPGQSELLLSAAREANQAFGAQR